MRTAEPCTAGEAGHDTGWQAVQLNVSRPAEAIAVFREAARGPGAVPWAIDSVGDRHLLLARLIAQAGGERLPRHAADLLAAIAQAQDAHHARMLAGCAMPGGGSAFDLHRLMPVPPALLQLGADHPDSLLWRDAHWGTREAVRQVALRDTRDPRHYRRRRLRYRCWMLDGQPEILAAALQRGWPALVIEAARLEPAVA